MNEKEQNYSEIQVPKGERKHKVGKNKRGKQEPIGGIASQLTYELYT